MVTREHIGDRLVSVRAQIPHFGVDGYGAKLRDDEEILTLALKALDTERDAALGAACRTAVADGETEYGVDFALVAADPSATEATDAFARDVFDAISAHIREEQKGET